MTNDEETIQPAFLGFPSQPDYSARETEVPALPDTIHLLSASKIARLHGTGGSFWTRETESKVEREPWQESWTDDNEDGDETIDRHSIRYSIDQMLDRKRSEEMAGQGSFWDLPRASIWPSSKLEELE